MLEYNPDIILISGYNEETKYNEFVWACNDYKMLLSKVKNGKKNSIISFIKKEWVEDFEKSGFQMYAAWCDYFSEELDKFKNNSKIEIIDDTKCKEASDVTMSCRYQSRGFTGQTENWMKLWIHGQEPAVPDYAKDCAVIGKRINGELAGIICVGVYGHESKKGPILWIREVAVKPEFQKKGIGRELIGQSFNYGIQKGATRSFLLADECNLGAIHLYKSFGFKNNTESEIDMILE